MKLLAILRIKDEILNIEACLSRLSEVVDEILILDNGSTDGTLEAYKNFPKIVGILETRGYDEGRDKCLLLEEAKKRTPDWIIWIDGDEVFEKNFTREEAEKYMQSKYNRIAFRMCNFWLDKERCRIDGHYFIYSLHPQRSMWRNLPVAYFANKKMHNGDIRGVPGKVFISPFRLKHFGYSDQKKIQEKFDRYLKEDPAGERNYHKLINPNAPFIAYKFREFNNKIVNKIYIVAFKYLCNVLWLAARLFLKIAVKLKPAPRQAATK